MRKELEQLVRRRAGDRCEYCRMPQSAYAFTFPIDHIIARQHGGKTRAANLALSCVRCNLRKGPNIAGIDPKTGVIVPLFHPRTERWADHFRRRGVRILGVKPGARATVRVLDINGREWLALRRALMAEGVDF